MSLITLMATTLVFTYVELFNINKTYVCSWHWRKFQSVEITRHSYYTLNREERRNIVAKVNIDTATAQLFYDLLFSTLLQGVAFKKLYSSDAINGSFDWGGK